MTDRIEALERLARLKTEGVLTDAEFEQQKFVILGQQQSEAAQVEPAVGTFAYGWQKSRGIRRVFNWFFGIQALAIAAAGVYFMTRVAHERPRIEPLSNQVESNVTDQSAVSENVVEAPPVSSSETDQSGIPTDIEISDNNLANPWTYDGSSDASLTASEACLHGDVTIFNHTSQPLKLQMITLEQAQVVKDFPLLPRGGSTRFRASQLGTFVLIREDRSSLHLLTVAECGDGD